MGTVSKLERQTGFLQVYEWLRRSRNIRRDKSPTKLWLSKRKQGAGRASSAEVGTVRDEYDVIVVGAGPRGSMAARTAAETCDVLLIEKRQEIGAPVRCEEGVLKSAFLELAQPNKKWFELHSRIPILRS